MTGREACLSGQGNQGKGTLQEGKGGNYRVGRAKKKFPNSANKYTEASSSPLSCVYTGQTQSSTSCKKGSKPPLMSQAEPWVADVRDRPKAACQRSENKNEIKITAHGGRDGACANLTGLTAC